eukprot:SAG31_NODE_14808_length_786_cov_1.502183_1_plen_64_part_10
MMPWVSQAQMPNQLDIVASGSAVCSLSPNYENFIVTLIKDSVFDQGIDRDAILDSPADNILPGW